MVLRFILGWIAWWMAAAAWALAPPTPGEQALLQASGQMPAQVQKAREYGNHRMDPQSIDVLRYRLGRAAGTIPPGAPPPAWSGGLPATGSPKVLVLLVDFADAPRDASNTPTLVTDRMFGAGGSSVAGYPYESLRAFYQRSSYGALNLSGYVAPWYRAKYSRAYYESLGYPRGNNALIEEALASLKATGHTFAQYDNNGDSYFDTLFVKWTGAAGPWASFWWAYQGQYTGAQIYDGKRPRKVIWSWVANVNYDGQSLYTPRVDIHETGHALGLPDYYDYDNAVGPRGGVGGLDMMDGNWGDHNAFSKFLLGWLTPTIVGSGSVTRTLNPSGTHADAVLFMPGASAGSLFTEYFLAQYRKRTAGNDTTYPTDGITLWHVDATLNGTGTDYLYDNSYTAHKLLRLVQADGLGQIENGYRADAGDFYTAAKTFGPNTTPNSNSYAGKVTNASMTGIGVAGASMPATFAAGNASYAMTVTKAGTGSGTVTSSPAGINCGTTCSATYTANTSVTLTATPAAGSTFTGWSGACTGSGTSCVVSMSAAKAVTATFALNTSYALSVSKTGTGSGTVTSSPAGINCGTTCGATYTANTTVTLTATPAAGSRFAGWTGACTGSASTCVVSMSAARSVTATFTLNTYALTVSKAGAGSGTVTSSPAGINCGATCGATYAANTTVTLTATPAAGSSFAGWTGACTGSGASCVVSMSAAKAVTATFTLNTYALTVSKTGTGSGTVTSSPAGINCGATCGANYVFNTTVTLTATPAAGSRFAGWTGACTGSGTSCVVGMSAARSVTATFTLNTYALTVGKTGTGSGTVTSSPAGINCGATCGANYVFNTTVTLTATPAAGSRFAGWTGACTGSGTSCVVSMSAARSVTATFTLNTYVLTVSKAGTGSGTVTSSPAGINCGVTCSASYVANTAVTLTATPAAGRVFGGWTGACTGSGTSCVVSMSAARAVTATFR